MANTWNKSGTTWGYNSWQSDTVTQAPDGLSLTASIGAVEAFNEQGWGSDTWGNENWGESGLDVSLTGLSLTATLGTFDYAQSTSGWGRTEYGNAGWGVTYSVAPDGLSMTAGLGSAEVQLLQILTAPDGLTSSLGTPITEIGVPVTAPSGLTSTVGALTEVSTNAGWGRDSWGQEPWGDSDEPVVDLTGLGLTSTVGEVSAYNEQGWGRDPWGYENWGESAMTVIVDASGIRATSSVGAIAPTEMSIGLTGVSGTFGLGTPGLVYGADEVLTGVSGTVSVGDISPADVMGLTGVSATTSVGAIDPADVMGLTGISATLTVGTGIEITQTTILTGLSATVSVGAIAPTEMSVGLTGLSATASVGAIAPGDVMGLTGISATLSVGQPGGPLAYEDITGTQSANYSDVDPL